MVNTSRRDRPPSGRVNLPRPSTAHPNSNYNGNNNSGRPPTGRPMSAVPTIPQLVPSSGSRNKERAGSAGGGDRFPKHNDSMGDNHSVQLDRESGGSLNHLVSTRSQESELSTGEVLRRMREKSEKQKNEIEEMEIEALGAYNAFSRPKSSAVMPLRTVFLDPAINNFPRSKTRSELMKRIRVSITPHSSYDLDNDGYVSQDDYKLAKRFDFDGNGLLDPDERNVGKHILAEEFFKRHASDLHNFGPSFAKNTHKQNVAKLVGSYSFERSYGKLLSVERTLTAESSKPLLDCIRNDQDESFQKNKYHTNKYDSTAWNDYDRLPRSSWMGETLNESDHGGSRRRLLFARKEQTKRELQGSLDRTSFHQSSSTQQPGRVTFGRVNMITDVRVENS